MRYWQVIKRTHVPVVESSEEDEQAPTTCTINHRIQVLDLPNDPHTCVVKVALLGKTEKIYYEKLWDVYRKIRSYVRS